MYSVNFPSAYPTNQVVDCVATVGGQVPFVCDFESCVLSSIKSYSELFLFQ